MQSPAHATQRVTTHSKQRPGGHHWQNSVPRESVGQDRNAARPPIHPHPDSFVLWAMACFEEISATLLMRAFCVWTFDTIWPCSAQACGRMAGCPAQGHALALGYAHFRGLGCAVRLPLPAVGGCVRCRHASRRPKHPRKRYDLIFSLHSASESESVETWSSDEVNRLNYATFLGGLQLLLACT